MGRRELIESLRKAGEEKAALLRREAGEEENKIRLEAEQRLALVRDECGRSHASETAQRIEAVISEAMARSRINMIAAEAALSDRLYLLARASLPRLRSKDHGGLLPALVRELPPYSWKEIQVNPADTDDAAHLFPDAVIIPDDNVSGGIDLAAEDGRIRVINTFEKRLERAWEDILPEIMKEIKTTIIKKQLTAEITKNS